jgi:tRNA(fMet)-specific endonuclease VapC
LKRYLLDTNICIFYMKGRFNLKTRFSSLPPNSLFISEITLAELKFGVENSGDPARHEQVLADFLTGVQLLPIIDTLDVFAREKTRLRRAGTPLDDFDLLIGATAVVHHLTLLTNNTRHLARVEQLLLEDWTQS